jgi:hypothetical protein
MKLKNIMACMLGLGTGNMCAQIIRYAFERSIAGGILSIIFGIAYVIAIGYFILGETK